MPWVNRDERDGKCGGFAPAKFFWRAAGVKFHHLSVKFTQIFTTDEHNKNGFLDTNFTNSHEWAEARVEGMKHENEWNILC